MSRFRLADLAQALGGTINRDQILAPGPGHSPGDRSLSVKLSVDAPGGFTVHSFAGDDWRDCRDHVAERLGLRRETTVFRRAQRCTGLPPSSIADRRAQALRLWDEAGDIRNTIAERYLRSRGLEPADCEALRYHPKTPWRSDTGLMYVPCMLSAFRTVEAGDAFTGVIRTRLSPSGPHLGRRMLGQAAGSAVKLDADDAVTTGLVIGEGVETCLTAQQLGFRPVWALGSAVSIANFPVLNGIEALTVLAENDPASDRAVKAVWERWSAAGREVIVIDPMAGKDLNDAARLLA